MSEIFWAPLNSHLVRNSHAQVVDAIGADIIQGRYPQGSILPRDEEFAIRPKGKGVEIGNWKLGGSEHLGWSCPVLEIRILDKLSLHHYIPI